MPAKSEIPDLRTVKRKLSPRLMALAGVCGVGVSGRRLAVYLVEDRTRVRRAIVAIVEAEAPGVEVAFVISGSFEKQ